MSKEKITKEELLNVIKVWKECDKSRVKTAEVLGIGNSSLSYRLELARTQGLMTSGSEPVVEEKVDAPFWIKDLPDEELPIEEIIDRAVDRFQRKQEAKEARSLIDVNLTKQLDGPFGLAIFGDPHLDDDGCNWPKLLEDIESVKQANMVAINIGDLTNNWVGRLMKLYAYQETTRHQAIKMIKWLLTESGVYWAAVIGGNHDMWNTEGGDINQFIFQNEKGIYQAHGVRLNLLCPNGREIRVNARHNFPGNSQWNEAHAISKAARFGSDHIYVAGHLHISGYQIVKDQESGFISQAVRVAGYKDIDSFKEQLGFRDHKIWESMAFIIDPYADNELEFIKPVFSIQDAAKELIWRKEQWQKQNRKK